MSAFEGTVRPIAQFTNVLVFSPDIRTKGDFKAERTNLRRWCRENVPGKSNQDWRIIDVDERKFLVCFMDDSSAFYFRMNFDASDYIR